MLVTCTCTASNKFVYSCNATIPGALLSHSFITNLHLLLFNYLCVKVCEWKTKIEQFMCMIQIKRMIECSCLSDCCKQRPNILSIFLLTLLWPWSPCRLHRPVYHYRNVILIQFSYINTYTAYYLPYLYHKYKYNE